ncbi:MAG: HD domain-containing phosphohydrolase [Halanaerobiales bacterium]
MFYINKLRGFLHIDNRVLQYRILSLTVAFFYVFFGLVFYIKNTPDPMGIQRYIALALLLGGFLMSFISAKFRANIVKIMFFSLVLLHTQLLYLGYINDFSPFYIVAIISIIFCSNLFFRNIYFLSYYNIGLTLLTIILIMLNYKQEGKFQLVMVILAASLLSFLINYSKILMERDMKDSKYKYKVLFQENPVGLITLKFDCEIIEVNKELLRIFKVKSSNYLLGKNLLDLVTFIDANKLDKIKERAYLGKTIRGTFNYQDNNKHDTRKKIIDYKIRPIFGENQDKIKEFIVAVRDLTEEKEYQNQINYLTYHDGLTGLYNRNYLNTKLTKIDVKENLPLSVIVGDLNGLKLTNDAFGHNKGDKILIRSAEIIKEVCRETDIPVRWGGDEFLIYLPNTTYHEARKIVRTISYKFEHVKIGPIQPTIALGFETKNEPEENIEIIFRQAEEHMYTNKLQESKNAHSAIISSLRKTLSETTNETSIHCKRVKNLVIKLGKSIGLSDHQLIEVGLLAELHDLGKVAVSEQILTKDDTLNDDEWDQIKKHCEIGYKVASSSPELSKIAEGILSHHEWWNGEGYPHGLKGEEIPLSSRIVAIVDAFDVMTNGRHYKQARLLEEAVDELIRGKGKQFDPELVDIFVYHVLKYDIRETEHLRR